MIMLASEQSTLALEQTSTTRADRDLVTEYIGKNILNQTTSERTNTRRAKFIATCFAACSGIPAVQPSIDAAGEYTGLGYIFAGGVLIAFGADRPGFFTKLLMNLPPKPMLKLNY